MSARQDPNIPHLFWAFLTTISGGSDELERARLTATGLPSLLPCALSGVALFDDADGGWRLVLQKDGKLLDPGHAKNLVTGLKQLARECVKHPTVLIAGTDEAPDKCRIPASIEKLGIQQLALAPLTTLRSRLGIVFLGKGVPDGFSQEDELVLLHLAEHLALAIENIRLYHTQMQHSQNLQDLVKERTEKLHQTEERHKVLLEINNAIVTNLDREFLFTAVTHALRKVLPFDRAALTLHDPERDVLRVYALAGVSSPKRPLQIGSEFPRKESHLASIFDEKRPIICRDLENKQRIGPEEDLLADGIRSYACAPLAADGLVFGSLNVASRVPDRYSESDAEFLMEVGQQVALAVKNMLAYEEIAELKSRLEQENIYLQEEIKTQHNFEEIIGKSSSIRKLLQAVETVAPTEANVVITGETGTGKELIARAVHSLSPRRSKPLIKVNCATIPRELFESEFFGHVRGSFTGAVRDRVGRFQLANGGTLFLDEIGEIPIELQSKLLRVLQEGEFERVGGERTRKVDVRIIAATNRDLQKEIDAQRFRQDLYYRLNVFPIEVKPLRDRIEDIPPLAMHFMQRAIRRFGMRAVPLKRRHISELQAYNWPGNVRELQNIIERAVITSRSGTLHFDLPSAKGATDLRASDEPVPSLPTARALLTYEELKLRERESILAALEQTYWKISGHKGAAELLGVKPTTLASRIKSMGIERPPKR